MKGGVIERSSTTSYWVYYQESEDDALNIMRHLESLFLNQFALNSIYKNSNMALSSNSVLILNNFKELCDQSQDITELDFWRNVVLEIIRLRALINDEKTVPPLEETSEEEQRRRGHEYRLELWTPILHGMTERMEETQLRLRSELEENDARIARELEMSILAEAVKDVHQPLPRTDTTAYELQREQDEVRFLNKKAIAAQQRREEETRKIALDRSAKQLSTEAKREYKERQLREAEAVMRQAQQITRKKSEEDEILQNAIKRSEKEKKRLDDIKAEKEKRIQETNRLFDAEIEKKTAAKEKSNSLKIQIDELKSEFLRQRRELLDQRDTLTESIKKIHETDPSRTHLLKKLSVVMGTGSIFMEQDKKIEELDKQREMLIASATAADKESQKYLEKMRVLNKSIDDPSFIPCYNTTCCNNSNKICSRCKLVRYCGPECQKAHWFKHKPFCKPQGGTKRKAKKTRNIKKTRKSRRYR
jgi:hypothetical protein